MRASRCGVKDETESLAGRYRTVHGGYEDLKRKTKSSISLFEIHTWQ